MNNILNEMIQKAEAAMAQAYSPYSNFKVGVCLRTENNKLFTGANIENSSYSLTLCAEATTIAQMITAGQTRIIEMVVTSSGDKLCFPCGACRQRIYEFADPEMLIHSYHPHQPIQTYYFRELLPLAFGPDDLKRSK